MKILGIALLILSLLTGLSVGIDLLMGFELRTSLYHAIGPLIVTDTAEFAVFLALIIMAVSRKVYTGVNKIIQRKKAT